MKYFTFLLFLFTSSITVISCAQEPLLILLQDADQENSAHAKNHKSKPNAFEKNGRGNDTLSEASLEQLKVQYQSLNIAPVLLIKTPEGQTYSVSNKGINFWDGSSNISITIENANIPENNITALALDAKNNLWIGSNSNGIVKGTGFPVKPFKTKRIKTHDLSVYSIVADNNGGMWVTYQDGGFEYFQVGISGVYLPATTKD